MDGKKTYGLILSKKVEKKTSVLPKASIFGDDSDDEDTMVAVNRDIKKESKRNLLKKQTQQSIEKALAEDPSIFDYDAVYDDMQETKKATDARINIDKTERKSRYVESLLKAAEKRTKENERRVERQVQKDREKEKGMFDDKEAFVTSAYKEKMRLIQEEEEKEKRMDAIEEAMEVKNQRDLSGFYRHILNQTTGDDPRSKVKEEVTEKQEDGSEKEKIDFSADRDLSSDSSSEDSSSESSTKNNQQPIPSKTRDNQRKYRQRKRNDSSDSDNNISDKNEHADSKSNSKSKEIHKSPDKSRRSRSKSPSRENSSKSLREKSGESRHRERQRKRSRDRSSSRDRRKHKRDHSNNRNVSRERNECDKSKDSNDRDKTEKDHSKNRKQRSRSKSVEVEQRDESKIIVSEETTDNVIEELSNDKPKVDEDPMAKYAKRNVGDKFDDARMRYFMRKQMRVIALAKDED